MPQHTSRDHVVRPKPRLDEEKTAHGCGSKICTQNGTLVSGNMDQHLRSPGGVILTHTHMLQRTMLTDWDAATQISPIWAETLKLSAVEDSLPIERIGHKLFARN